MRVLVLVLVCARYGGMIDESGCLFGCWTVPNGRARGEKDIVALLDDREDSMTGFYNSERTVWCGGTVLSLSG